MFDPGPLLRFMVSHPQELGSGEPCEGIVASDRNETVATNALLQQSVPDAWRGRAVALYSMSFAGTAPIGNILAGTSTRSNNSCYTASLAGRRSIPLSFVHFLHPFSKSVILAVELTPSNHIDGPTAKKTHSPRSAVWRSCREAPDRRLRESRNALSVRRNH